MHYSVLALDIGFGRTKMAVRLPEGDQIFTDSFPSLTPRLVSSNLSSHITNAAANRIYTVKVDGVDFAVGPDVKFAIGGTTGSGRTLTDDFPTSVNYIALFLGALQHVSATDIDILVLGLPVHTMKKYDKILAQKFAGTFQLVDNEVTIRKVIVLPQPVGAMIQYSTTRAEEIVDGEKRLIIDCGYRTTDWVVADGYRMIESRSSGTPIGVSTILHAIADLIAKDSGHPCDELEAIDDSLYGKKKFRHFKSVYQASQLKALLKNAAFISDDCAKLIKTNVGTGSDLESILLVGGGAHYFYDSVAKSFPDAEIENMNDSPNCNVLGFLTVGEHQAAKLRAA